MTKSEEICKELVKSNLLYITDKKEKKNSPMF